MIPASDHSASIVRYEPSLRASSADDSSAWGRRPLGTEQRTDGGGIDLGACSGPASGLRFRPARRRAP
jgi:hypothetical protein